ncbi:hypothetical protein ACFWPZ_40855, partial [Streptomyces sp. NPDC058475]
RSATSRGSREGRNPMSDQQNPHTRFGKRTASKAQAAAALRRLADEDPKTYGQLCGGNRERAEELGFSWPDSA